jgi:antitoxin (DNA-binding transcriptional repressor) of toxin-antitoxin stability system
MVSWQESKTMTMTEFRAKCLAVFRHVKATGDEIVVTKRGVPWVSVGRPTAEEEAAWAADPHWYQF